MAVFSAFIQLSSGCGDAVVGRTGGIGIGGAGTSAAGAASAIRCAAGIPVTKSGATCATGPISGDADCSGVVDTIDALKVAQRAEEMAVPAIFEVAGDVNCDGCLSKEDATTISEYVVGQRTTLSCP
jgi:hypothetical protein